MDIFKIVVNNELKNFRVFKKIKIDEKNIKQKIIYIQDQDYDIFTNGPIEIQDSVLNGSSLFQPLLIKSINELPYFINQRLQLQLNNDSKLIGKLISIEYNNNNNNKTFNNIILDLEDLNSLKVPKVFKDKNNISILTLDIQSFIPLENNQNFNNINHNNNNNNNNSIKIILNEDKTFRDIIISYDIPFLSSQVSTTLLPSVQIYNSFSNIIQGDINIDSIYNDKELKSKIPITFKTVFSWFPKWTIISNEGIELIIISNDGKQRYIINNFKCIKDHFTQTTVNVFQSSITRALLFEPLLGTFKYSIYFKNNSNIIINKSNNIKIINDNHNQISNNNNNHQNEYFLLNNISPNKRGIVIVNNNSININNLLFKDISFINNNNKYSSSSPSPSNSNSSILSSNIQYNQLKLSKDYTLLFTNNKIKSSYSIFNISDINTKYIVYYSESFQIPLSSNHSSKLLSNGKEISTNCFIFKGDSFSITKIKITNLIESIYISDKLSNEIIELLKENNIDINFNNKNELYNISYLSEEVKDRVIKSLILENTASIIKNKNIKGLFLKEVYDNQILNGSGNKSSDNEYFSTNINNFKKDNETLEKQVKDPINLFEVPHIEKIKDGDEEDGIEYLIPKSPIKNSSSGNNSSSNNKDNGNNSGVSNSSNKVCDNNGGESNVIKIKELKKEDYKFYDQSYWDDYIKRKEYIFNLNNTILKNKESLTKEEQDIEERYCKIIMKDYNSFKFVSGNIKKESLKMIEIIKMYKRISGNEYFLNRVLFSIVNDAFFTIKYGKEENWIPKAAYFFFNIAQEFPELFEILLSRLQDESIYIVPMYYNSTDYFDKNTFELYDSKGMNSEDGRFLTFFTSMIYFSGQSSIFNADLGLKWLKAMVSMETSYITSHLLLIFIKQLGSTIEKKDSELFKQLVQKIDEPQFFQIVTLFKDSFSVKPLKKIISLYLVKNQIEEPWELILIREKESTNLPQLFSSTRDLVGSTPSNPFSNITSTTSVSNISASSYSSTISKLFG